jgi:hypothetical protein
MRYVADENVAYSKGIEWPASDNIIMALFAATSKDLTFVYILAYGSRTTLSTISLESVFLSSLNANNRVKHQSSPSQM